MYFRTQTREFLYSLLLVVLLTTAAFGVTAFMTGPVTTRLVAAVGGAAICFLGARISGNPRLFCLWGLGFSIPFLFAKTFGPVLDKGGGEVAYNIDVTDLFLFALCAYLARDILKSRRTGIRIPRVSYFWGAIMALGLGTIIAGPFRTAPALEIVRMIKMLVLFLVLCQELESPRRILHWSGALTLGLFVNAVVGLAQSYYKTTLGLADLGEASDQVTKALAAESVSGVEVWRVGAFLLHPNIFGAFLAAVLPLVVVCFLLRNNLIYKLYYLSAFLLGIGALIATESRSGWVSFTAALSCCLFISIAQARLRQRSMLTALFLFAVLMTMIVVARNQIMARIFESKEEALTYREVFKDDAKRMIADSPLWGFGLNTYVLHLPDFATYQYGSWPPPVHHIYYLWWAETGLIGLTLHLAMWANIVWTGIRNLRVRDERLFAVNAACLSGMLAFALDGFVSFSLRITPTLKTFWALAAMIMAIRYWRLRNEVYPAVVAASPRPRKLKEAPLLPVAPLS